MQLSGPPNGSVQLQYSSDLIDWSVVPNIPNAGKVQLDASGFATVTDTTASTVTDPIRFYRADGSSYHIENSANSVGYVDKTIPVGHSYICNPPHRTDESLAALFPTATGGDTVSRFNSITGVYESTSFDNIDNVWFQPGWLFPPGIGFDYLNVGVSSSTVTFVGEVVQRSFNALPSNWALVGSALPVSRVINALGFPIDSGDVLLRQTGGVQTSYSYWNGVWSPTQPKLAVGESFFLGRVATWQQNMFIFP